MDKIPITFSPSLGPREVKAVGRTSTDILARCAAASGNPAVTITSTLRPPARQAKAMYDNLSRGVRIKYAAPGREITALYDRCMAAGDCETSTLVKMTALIGELAAAGRLVSRHCVTEEQYAAVNVIDCSKNLPHPRDFVRELVKEDAVLKVITPVPSAYGSTKVIIDGSEPAIHIEIRQ